MSHSPTRTTETSASHCSPKARGKTTFSLPVLKADHAGGKVARSKVSKWRAVALVLVHVLIAAHIVQWWITGMTVSPVEPSESMQTLREGVVNAGFVFFVLAILSTLILGRFFCGWACHIVALQDLCSWMMNRIGVKPKPFRSRLLVFVPLILALYMFVWPVVHREVLRPLFADSRGRLPVWLGQSEPLPGLTSEFLVDDFWATFAPWPIAIPFIFVCTFGAVYFLGSKGFCTYGCPYGGFFGPADLLAPGKIRVTDACEHCGHCTAVCTSNVRVHEEVRDFGMVVDPGCMKCLDCISVCPNDALYFGLGKPTILAGIRPGAEDTAAKAKAMRAARYDLSRTEEIIVGVLFWALFLCFRGMFNLVPMLMAVGLAGIGSFAAWKTWRTLIEPSTRLQSLQLKLKGRLRPLGALFILGTLALLVAAGWSGWVRAHLWRAELNYARLETPIGVVIRPDFQPTTDETARAQAALEHYRLAGPRGADGSGAGGFGWPVRPDDLTNIAYMHLLLGDKPKALATLREIIERGHPTDALIQQTVRVMAQTRASQDQMRDMLRDALARHPDLDQTRAQLAAELAMNNDRAGAVAMWEQGLKDNPRSANTRLAAAGFFLNLGTPDDTARAKRLLDEAVALAHHKPDVYLSAAGLAMGLGDRERASKLANDAVGIARSNAAQQLSAAGMLAQIGESEKALMEALRGVDNSRKRGRHSGQPDLLMQAAALHFRVAGVQAQQGKTADSERTAQEGKKLLRESVALIGDAPWELASAGASLVNTGVQAEDGDLVALGVKSLERARDLLPDAPSIRHDLAVAYGFSGNMEGAEREMVKAAETAKGSAMLAERLAQLLRERGNGDESDKWMKEAERRRAAP